METIEIYGNKRGNLVLNKYNKESGRVEYTVYDKAVDDYLQKLSKYQITEINEKTIRGKDVTVIKYPGLRLNVHDVDNLGIKETYLFPLFAACKKHYERGSISRISQNTEVKPRVKRTNKHANKSFVAPFLVTGVLIASMFAISNNQSYSPEDLKGIESILNLTGITSQNSIDFDNYSDENISYISDNDIITFESSSESLIEESEVIQEKSCDTICIEYEDLSNTNKAIFARENYGEIIEKQANKYGVDPNLMLGIATQERGVHSNQRDKGGATGLMQIQNSVWLGEEISAFNFETGEYDKFKVTKSMIENLDTNVQLGCMIFQNCLRYVDYNIPLAVQTYNYGIGNIKKVVDVYAGVSNKTRQEVYDNPSDIGWIEYRDIIKVGDSNYLNKVFSWMGDENNISVIKNDNTVVNLTVANSNNMEVNKTY